MKVHRRFLGKGLGHVDDEPTPNEEDDIQWRIEMTRQEKIAKGEGPANFYLECRMIHTCPAGYEMLRPGQFHRINPNARGG